MTCMIRTRLGAAVLAATLTAWAILATAAELPAATADYLRKATTAASMSVRSSGW
jgi:hypothetical protein